LPSGTPRSEATIFPLLPTLKAFAPKIMTVFSFLVVVVLNISGSAYDTRLRTYRSVTQNSVSLVHRLNPKVLELVRQFNEQKKPIASLCHGPQVRLCFASLGSTTVVFIKPFSKSSRWPTRIFSKPSCRTFKWLVPHSFKCPILRLWLMVCRFKANKKSFDLVVSCHAAQ